MNRAKKYNGLVLTIVMTLMFAAGLLMVSPAQAAAAEVFTCNNFNGYGVGNVWGYDVDHAFSTATSNIQIYLYGNGLTPGASYRTAIYDSNGRYLTYVQSTPLNGDGSCMEWARLWEINGTVIRGTPWHVAVYNQSTPSDLSGTTYTNSNAITSKAVYVNACGSYPSSGGQATLNSIAVSPSSINMTAGGAQQITVTAAWSTGWTTDVTASSSYLSSDTGKATVSVGGLVTCQAQGNANINVSYSGKTANVPVTVTAPVVTSIAASPSSINLPAGLTQQLIVNATMSNGTTQDVSAASIYQSSDADKATVSSGGVVTCNAQGNANVTVSYSGKTTNVPVTVTSPVVTSIAASPSSINLPAGFTQQLIVNATMSNGTTQDVTAASIYQSSDADIATVSIGGLVTCQAQGSANVTVSYSGLTATVPVTVQPAVVTITINSVSAVNGTVTVTLSDTPAGTPVIGDFTLTQAINGGTATVITPTAISTSGAVVTLTVPWVSAIPTDQSVIDTAGYKGGTAVAAPAFTVGKTTRYVISISPSPPLAAVTMGSTYTQVFTASGGTGQYTYSISGNLPTGLIFDNGTLSGNLTVPGYFVFTVTATDSNGVTGSVSYTLVVNSRIKLH